MSATPDATRHDSTRNPVKEVREALGFSQDKMAHEMGCTQATISRCEQNGTLPSKPYVLSNLHRLAKQAGIEIEL